MAYDRAETGGPFSTRRLPKGPARGPGEAVLLIRHPSRSTDACPRSEHLTPDPPGSLDLDQALHPIDYVEHDWNKEVWTRGGPVANYQPGIMTTVGHTIRKPFGRVHWAGTETSTYWTGYMDGAVRAGKRAALEVLKK